MRVAERGRLPGPTSPREPKWGQKNPFPRWCGSAFKHTEWSPLSHAWRIHKDTKESRGTSWDRKGIQGTGRKKKAKGYVNVSEKHYIRIDGIMSPLLGIINIP